MGSRDGWEEGTQYDFAAARYNPDGSLDAGTGPQGSGRFPGGGAGILPLTVWEAQPLLTAALARPRTGGIETGGRSSLSTPAADRGGAALGLASGNTAWLDDNAAGTDGSFDAGEAWRLAALSDWTEQQFSSRPH